MTELEEIARQLRELPSDNMACLHDAGILLREAMRLGAFAGPRFVILRERISDEALGNDEVFLHSCDWLKEHVDDSLYVHPDCGVVTWFADFGRNYAVVANMICAGPRGAGGESEVPQSHLSKVMTPTEAGRLFGIGSRQFVRRFNDGKIRGKRLTSKSYQIHVDDLPQTSRR